MKTRIAVSIIVGFFCWNVLAQSANQDVTNGLNFLAAEDLTDANAQFTNALVLSPTNEAANALAAATRLLLLPTQPAGSNFLNSLGFSGSGRNIYDWTSTLPVDINGNTVVPTNNTLALIAFYRTNILAALGASQTNLAAITDTNFNLSLTSGETSLQAVTLDYGDILVLQALVRMGEFLGYTLNAQNFGVVISQLHNLGESNQLTIQSVLSTYPNLLAQNSASDLAASKGALANAIALYLAASDFIRNVRAPGAQALFNLSPDETNTEAIFRSELTNVLASLNQPVLFKPNSPATIYAGAYFAGAKPLRSLVPQFSGNVYLNDTLPDYTFGGILQNQPAYKTESFFRKEFYSYAGIYSGSVYDLTYGDPSAGSVSVYVSTNQHVVVVGYDIDSANNISDGQSSGIGAQFTLDPNGNWSFQSNSVSGFGSIGKDGSFDGELDFTNGDSVQISGNQLPPLGSFQNSAGYYTGNYSGGNSSGTLQGVLDSSGYLIVCVLKSDGTLTDGVFGQIDSSDHFSGTSANGGSVSGTLSPSAATVNGSFSSGGGGGSGSFNLTRSSRDAFDVPPVLTKNLPATLIATLGTNVTFSLVVTGSPPLSYQWYDNNGVLIPFTITNTLTLTNVQYASAGTYSVAINNCVGGTNSSVTLTVVPETVPPTNQIITPTSGLQVSNANYTVTGKAGDNVAVSNVLVQLNNGGWNPATTFNGSNWTAQVILTPGSNTFRAYAVDTSGNLSATNTVIFKYVVSAPLTVQLTGRGTITPNYSNNVLQVGSPYSVTAAVVAGSGFAFTNWTGGTSLPLARLTNSTTLQFVMVSNLMLQANFVDTNKPVLNITNLTAGLQVSNANYTVRGTATDNVAVAQVYFQLNGSGWTNVSSFVGTNWSTPVTLTAGSNTFRAYAVDTSGNVSATNTVIFDYVVSAILKVSTNGLGTLSPNDNGASLQIGKNYSITATPGSGIVFTNWTGGTNLPLAFITNGTTIQFLMVSNLMLQANFVDVTKPSLTITAPSAGQHMSNALAYVTGTASDNWKVAQVWCQLNSNAWDAASSTNGWTNWTTVFKLVSATNKINAYAVDLGGNISTTGSVSVLSSNTFKLLLNLTNVQPGNVGFNLQLSTGLSGHIQVSSNLVNWVTLTNFVGTNAAANFRDPAATNGSRFYRAVVP